MATELGLIRFGDLLLNPAHITAIHILRDADSEVKAVEIKMQGGTLFPCAGDEARSLAACLRSLIPDLHAGESGLRLLGFCLTQHQAHSRNFGGGRDGDYPVLE